MKYSLIFGAKFFRVGNNLNKSSCFKLSVKVVQTMEAGNSIMEMLK